MYRERTEYLQTACLSQPDSHRLCVEHWVAAVSDPACGAEMSASRSSLSLSPATRLSDGPPHRFDFPPNRHLISRFRHLITVFLEKHRAAHAQMASDRAWLQRLFKQRITMPACACGSSFWLGLMFRSHVESNKHYTKGAYWTELSEAMQYFENSISGTLHFLGREPGTVPFKQELYPFFCLSVQENI